MESYNQITSFEINNNTDLEIIYDSSIWYVYENLSDIYINKDKDDLDCFVITDIFDRKLVRKDIELVNKMFWMKYWEENFKNNIVWSMNLLQIEWSLTLYLLYESKKVIVSSKTTIQ